MKRPLAMAGLIPACGFLLGCETTQPDVGEPLAGLTQSDLSRFRQGREVFEQVFTPQDGLGPIFNGAGCITCHNRPVPGGSSSLSEVHATRFVPGGACDPLFEEGGPILQQLATAALRDLGTEREVLPPGATDQGVRTTPPLFGLGLVDAIPEAAILANEDPDDADGDGISGRANRFIDGRVGRFGRKAFIPSLFDFNAGAFPLEQGITTPLSPVEETINGLPVPPNADPAADPEITLAEVELVHDFVRFLAPPPRVQAESGEDRERLRRGEMLFAQAGCADCHVPEMVTGPVGVPALNGRTVALYSDLLLHDMGPDNADICLGEATPAEFRTEMLMGLRLRTQFLHDGSASSVREAIERHDGEAMGARGAFQRLGEQDQQALLDFLNTL